MSRQEAAQRVLSQGDATRSTLINSIAQITAGESQLTSMIIRSRMAAEAKEKAQPTKWYA